MQDKEVLINHVQIMTEFIVLIPSNPAPLDIESSTIKTLDPIKGMGD